MKKIIVFGGAGGTGILVVKQALKAGHLVTVIVRDPEAFQLKHPHLKIITGDVLQPETFKSSIRGQDVVVSCLGTKKRKPTTIYSEGVGNIIKIMQKENVNRIICISAGAIIVPLKSSFILKFITKNILQRMFKYIYADMLQMEKLLTETNFDWTVIRAPWLRDGKATGKYRIAVNEPLANPSKISRADLADYIVNHIATPETFKGQIEISY